MPVHLRRARLGPPTPGALLPRLAGALVHRVWALAEQYGRVTAERPGRYRFARLGDGVCLAFPPGAVFGERAIAIGDGTLVGAQVSLSAGFPCATEPGPGLPGLVVRIGARCMIARGTHIVGHHRIDIGDDVFIAPYAYLTDQNHGYTDPDRPIGGQPPVNEPVVIGDGCWLGTGVTVLPGTRLGRNVTVAAGAVVRGTFPDRCVIAGVPARIVRRYVPGRGWQRTTDEPRRHQEDTMKKAPEGDIPIMIVGDSISHGSSGDWTWRYFFWKHLKNEGLSIDLVGPKDTLDNIRTEEVGDDDATYADPEFDRDHDAQWGRPYVQEKDVIEAKVAEYEPEYLLVLLGINDLFWYGVTPDRFAANLREFLANARRPAPDVRIVIGTVLETQKALDDPEFAKLVAATNEQLRAVAAESGVAVAETAAEFSAPEHTWDGTHPNPNGELRIAAAFADRLAETYGLGAPYPRPYPVLDAVAPEAKAPVDIPD
ncbi:GDSL-type esterase/lipase family protein [Streptomyces sp. Q6]|uniref:GDSL-type esterase/lipase family protein n=1 Tax=Streptomyces citrinus TaxID=3118173 RepID=A0ACD5AEG5_9ACTN